MCVQDVAEVSLGTLVGGDLLQEDIRVNVSESERVVQERVELDNKVKWFMLVQLSIVATK